jgi:hypothetical protein
VYVSAKNPSLPALTAFDYLSAVDDFSRVGALRLRDGAGEFLHTVEKGKSATPPLVELQRMYDACRAVERADYFNLRPEEALKALAAVYAAVRDWRTVALSADVGLLETELDDFAPAFEHPDMSLAQDLLA